ncbi:MAG: hypothetical protein R2932_31330 [Caldilineaceae bacterium]
MTSTFTNRAWLRSTGFYLVVLFFLLWTIGPVVWIATMSVQPEINYVTVPPTLRFEDVSLHWYGVMLADTDFLNALKASTIVATTTMIFCLFFGSLVAYPLARLQIRARISFW